MKRVRAVLLMGGAVGAFSAEHAKGFDKYYVNPATNGAWTDLAAWSPSGTPTYNDNAYLIWDATRATDGYCAYYQPNAVPNLSTLIVDATGPKSFAFYQGAYPHAMTADQVYVGKQGRALYDLYGGASLLAGSVYIGYGGTGLSTFKLRAGGQLTSQSVDIGINNGADGEFINQNGIHQVNGYLALGISSGSNVGTYRLEGGSLNAPLQEIGIYGVGNFLHSGGTNSVTTMYLGDNTQNGMVGSGMYAMSNTANLQAQTVHVGYKGIGVFNFTKGTVDVTNLYVGSQGGSTGTFNQTYGTLTVTNLRIADQPGSTGTFVMSNGTVTASSPVLIKAGGTFNMTGGKFNAPSMEINGGRLDKRFFGSLVIGGPVKPDGMFYVGSDGVSGTLDAFNGARVTADSTSLGVSGGTGTANITGANTTWSVDNLFRVGWSGHGVMYLGQGARLTAYNGEIGTAPGAWGEATVGLGSTWTNTNSLVIAGTLSGSGSSRGTLNIFEGGTVTTPKEIRLYNSGEAHLFGGTMTSRDLKLLGGKVYVHNGYQTLVRTNTLTIDTAGKSQLDIGDATVLVDYSGTSPIKSLRDYIIAGKNNGDWTGPGITSVSAQDEPGRVSVACVEAKDLLGIAANGTGTYRGQSVDGTTLILRRALAGDANLDDSCNFNDLVKLAQNYNNATGNATWFQGDFTDDGKIDFNDLVKLAQNYNSSYLNFDGLSGSFGASFSVDVERAFASAPEPAMLAWIGVAGVTLRRGRRASIS